MKNPVMPKSFDEAIKLGFTVADDDYDDGENSIIGGNRERCTGHAILRCPDGGCRIQLPFREVRTYGRVEAVDTSLSEFFKDILPHSH
jgi:hypothetical protein